MAMGMMTLSAAFMKFAAEQSATMREVRGNIRNLAIFTLRIRAPFESIRFNDHHWRSHRMYSVQFPSITLSWHKLIKYAWTRNVKHKGKGIRCLGAETILTFVQS